MSPLTQSARSARLPLTKSGSLSCCHLQNLQSVILPHSLRSGCGSAPKPAAHTLLKWRAARRWRGRPATTSPPPHTTAHTFITLKDQERAFNQRQVITTAVQCYARGHSFGVLRCSVVAACPLAAGITTLKIQLILILINSHSLRRACPLCSKMPMFAEARSSRRPHYHPASRRPRVRPGGLGAAAGPA